jgi:hypothetical protein
MAAHKSTGRTAFITPLFFTVPRKMRYQLGVNHASCLMSGMPVDAKTASLVIIGTDAHSAGEQGNILATNC